MTPRPRHFLRVIDGGARPARGPGPRENHVAPLSGPPRKLNRVGCAYFFGRLDELTPECRASAAGRRAFVELCFCYQQYTSLVRKFIALGPRRWDSRNDRIGFRKMGLLDRMAELRSELNLPPRAVRQ